MADPATYRPAAGSVPDQPGVYRFSDERGRVIYVGKAKTLRSRLSSYFQDVAALHPRTRTMVLAAAKVDWTVVETEVEALQLEYSWIKEFDPRFNVRYRDDKSYPSLAVTLYEEFPRLQVMRGPKRKGVRYFGPYAHAWAIRETLDLLLRVFPARTCSAGVFKRSAQIGRPCLLGYIGKCAAPCVGRVTAEEHREIVDDFCDFMAGQTTRYLKRLEREMKIASDHQEYEKAARLRDDIGSLKRAMEKQAVVLPDGTDADVVGIAEDSLEAAVQLFHVRGGRVRGQRGWVVDKVEDVSTGQLIEQFLMQLYGETGSTPIQGRTTRAGKASGRLAESAEVAIPREVLVPAVPDDADAVVEWLERLRGSRVEVRVPQRGDKRALLQTVTRNAQQALVLHKTRRASDLTTRSRALEEIQEALELPAAPLRIEAFDVSNLQGTEVVASMVVFEDGLARKSEYRRFVIRGLAEDGKTDDTRSIHEVISRRFRRFIDAQEALGPVEVIDPDACFDDAAEPDRGSANRTAGAGSNEAVADVPAGIDPTTGRVKKFAYPPNLVVVDGGAPQVAAARRAMDELGIDDVALCGLAKRLEEVWLPGEDDPVILPRTSEGLYLLQRVRDEAHRFAIAHHRERRSKAMTSSALDGIPGLGEVRRKALLRHFGSLRRLREATVDEIVEVEGVGPRTADLVVAALARTTTDRRPTPTDPRRTVSAGVNTSTGEILDEEGR